MPGQLKWDHNQASSAISSLNSASGHVSGDSVTSPSGCGWSASAASTVVSNLQSALSRLQLRIPATSSSLSTADTNMTTVDGHVAGSVPSSSSVPPSLMSSSRPLIGTCTPPGSGSSSSNPASGGVKPQFSIPQPGSSTSHAGSGSRRIHERGPILSGAVSRAGGY